MPTVLCLGDGIVAGDDATPSGYRTFRGTLFNLLATAGVANLNFVGPNLLAPASGGTDPDHAGYVNTSIDSTGSSTNNLTSRLAALKSAYPAPDLILLYVGWWDVLNAPTSLATRFATFLNLVNATAADPWNGRKVVIGTLHPFAGQTEVQTGSTYAAYASLNSQIRTLCAASPTTRLLADAAALSGASQSAFVERLLSRAQAAPDTTTVVGGTVLAPGGGHLITSFKSIQDYNGQWSQTPPAAGSAGGGGPRDLSPTELALQNGVNVFVRDVQCVVPWLWIWPLPGNTATNTCLEVRNGFAQGRHSTRGWEFFFQGARFGGANDYSASSPANTAAYGSPTVGLRSDGITSFYRPDGNTAIEVWPLDTSPSRGVIQFYGGRNRELLANSLAFCWGLQARLALINPNGVDDRANARFLVTCGADYVTESVVYRYDRIGWPLDAQDGGHDAWEDFRATNWTLIGSISIGRGGAGSTTANSHYADPGIAPPLANWSPATPYNDIPTYSLTADQIRATPPLVPSYWEASGGSGSGYALVDYWLDPATNQRGTYLMQSGADKLASVFSVTIITKAALGSGSAGGIIFSPLPGLPAKPNVFLTLAGAQVNVEPKAWDTSLAPFWGDLSLPPAVVGTPYAAQVIAGGSPAPTYSIVSGAPGWASLLQGATRNKIRNVAISGAVAGTPGTPPTNWAVSAGSTLSTQIVGSGTEDGIAYLDVRFFGTNTSGASQFPSIAFDTITAVPASTGQQWAGSLYARRTAGTALNPDLSLHEHSSVPAFLRTTVIAGGALPTTGTLSAARRSGAATLGASTAYVRLLLAWTVTNGATIDFTVRVGAPQLEQAAAATLFLDPAQTYLVGTPTGAATTNNITVRATNGVSPDADKALSLLVVTGLTITTTTLPNTVQNEFYSVVLEAVGAQPITWSIVGSLPAGLTLSGNVISGFPTAASGTTSFSIKASNGINPDVTQAVSITAGTSTNKPVITTTSLTDGALNTAYTATLAATGATPITWSIPVGSLPLGLSLAPSTGVISGTPTVTGLFPITVKAKNAFDEDTRNLFILVTASATVTVAASPWGKLLR